jgi:hypothetical protein
MTNRLYALTFLLGFAFISQAQTLPAPNFIISDPCTPTSVKAEPPTNRWLTRSTKTKKRSGSIYMRYIDYLADEIGLSPVNLQNNYSLDYLFPDSLMLNNPPLQMYGMNFLSIAQVFHPQSPMITSWLNPNDIVISNTDDYVIDSVWIGGSYAKVSNAVDSMKVSVVHSGGNNLNEFYFTGTDAQNYNVDTLRFLLPTYDTVNFNRAHQSYAPGSSPAYIMQRALTDADSSHYVFGSNNFTTKYIGFSVDSFLVPAGEKASVSFTFLPGYSWSAGDTIGQHNRFLFGSYEPNGASSFMPYFDNERNMSYFITKYNNAGWGGYYMPQVAFNSSYFNKEIHDIVWKISCATCATNNPTSLPSASAIQRITTYPNPITQGELNLSMQFEHPMHTFEMNVYNLQGQLLRSKKLNAWADPYKVETSVDVSNLPSGLYVYTIQLDDETYTDKISIVQE